MTDNARPARPLLVPAAGVPVAPEPVTMAEALIALATRAGAEEPTIAVLLFEAKGVVHVRPIPASLHMARALVDEAYDQLHAGREASE